MGNGVLAILQFGLFTFLAAMGTNILIAVASHLYAAMIRHNAREDQIKDRIVRYSRIANGLQTRVEARKNAAAGAASQLFGSQRQEKLLRGRLRELEGAPHRFVRMVGTEVQPNRAYEFLVMNSSVAHQVKRGERHPFYDSSWARPCPVHVWAKGPEEAKAEFERVFPKAAGFKIVFAQALQADGKPGNPLVLEGDTVKAPIRVAMEAAG